MNWMMGTYLSGKSIQFDGKNPWVSGEDFPNKTNPFLVTSVQLIQTMIMTNTILHILPIP